MFIAAFVPLWDCTLFTISKMREREPKRAARVIRRAKTFLGAVRPARWAAGRARRDLVWSDAHVACRDIAADVHSIVVKKVSGFVALRTGSVSARRLASAAPIQ